MMVRLRAFARFREVLGDSTAVELPGGATMAALLAKLRDGPDEQRVLLFEETGDLKGYVILMRNGKRVKRDEIETLALADGDEIALLPPVAGG